PSVGVGVGGGSGGARGGIGVSLPIGGHKQQVGTFTLDVVDVAKNAQVWSGSVDVGIQAQQISDEEADQTVRVIFEKIPDPAAERSVIVVFGRAERVVTVLARIAEIAVRRLHRGQIAGVRGRE